MRVFKALMIIALWILVSFFWVSLGQSREMKNTENVESWLKPYPLLNDWYKFYKESHTYGPQAEEFFKTLASSEPLSIKLNQSRVTFDQFYVPLSHLISVDWARVKDGSAQGIQSDLSQIDHGLQKTLSRMNLADQDYFRSMVLLDLPSEFAKMDMTKRKIDEHLLSNRLNRKEMPLKRPPINYKEVNPLPYKRVYTDDRF